MSDAKTYRAVVRRKGESEWKTVMHGGINYYCDDQGLGQLRQMTAIMMGQFPQNEYLIEEYKICP